MAEYGWGLTEQLMRKAHRELNEIAERRRQDIETVREQIESKTDINFLRTDDAFILRFLRARKFDTDEAFKLLCKYFEYRQKNTQLFHKFCASEMGIKHALFDSLPGVLPYADHNGRKILVLFAAHWDNSRYSLSSIYRAILLTLERLIEEEANQINGFVIVVDWTEFTFKQSTYVNPKLLKSMVEGLQDCFPARFGGVHFINQPWFVEAILKVVKPFLKEKTKGKIHLHGNNLGTLHNYIHKEVLPAELGGLIPPYNTESWAKELIGDEIFSYGESHIFWPTQEIPDGIPKSNSQTKFPDTNLTTKMDTPDRRELDEEFFLIE
ncbi:clavesin-2 [Lingula anatina]|uniref:Clavesin-2 n=1 Tax=Lingula anatina TaxID=7574 RepID=A0A1S3K6W6_LINAN|nr:clavesin-2 [Lingula anatina]XP_013418373.1 clavesin-2 [Lingula anatina]XP_013418374.1 clavesin-2 [Lingula anatina]XP_013418376.1 clavesin-2 [Lingula anatina]|eukprot:XP_013418372.1 clavesin-2 [Lingula anatina]